PIKYLIIFLIPIALGLFLLLKDDQQIDIKYVLFLSIWFAGTIYASTNGTRFVLLLVPAYAIAVGISLGTFQSILSNLVSKEFNINKKIVSGVVVVLLLLLLINPIKAADRTAKGEIPSMNDGWYTSLTKIKNNSSENAIITSWWDFGHWFKAIADRPVTFDGGTQNRPQAHWVGKILLTADEEQAIGILRMLDCGANNAFDETNKKYDDTEDSVDVVYEIIAMEKEEAKTYLLAQEFSENETDTILSYTHCEPPEAFFITSGDMVGKAGVWAHFGSWDFDKSYIYNNIKHVKQQEAVKILTKKFNFTEEQASGYYYEVQSLTSDQLVNNWVAPWPNYMTPGWRGCSNTSEIATCNIGMGIGQSNLGQTVTISQAIINLSNPADTKFILAFIDPNTGLPAAQQEAKPMNVVIADETLTKYDVGGEDMLMDLVYDKVANRALLTDPALSQSTFTKLFYLDGRYTEHFERFSDLTDVVGSRIIVWKVKW
ncbi:STT3 domain-containing protein, partial [Bacteroidota bacterium]